MKKEDKYSRLAPYYDLFVNWEQRLAREIPFILESCGKPESGSRALDIGCGTGHHLTALREAGFEVQGTEPSEALRVQAMRNLPGSLISPQKMEQFAGFAGAHGPWDLVICLGNTLPHLPGSLLPEFCRSLYHALKDRATAVIHVLGYEKILAGRPHKLPLKTIEESGTIYRFERSYEYEKDHLVFSIKVWKNDVQAALDREVIYPLTARMLQDALSDAGFDEIDFYGAFDRRIEYGPDSDNLVAVLRNSSR